MSESPKPPGSGDRQPRFFDSGGSPRSGGWSGAERALGNLDAERPPLAFAKRLVELHAAAEAELGPKPTLRAKPAKLDEWMRHEQAQWEGKEGRRRLLVSKVEAILALVEAVATLPDSSSYSVDPKYWTGVPKEALAQLRDAYEALDQ